MSFCAAVQLRLDIPEAPDVAWTNIRHEAHRNLGVTWVREEPQAAVPGLARAPTIEVLG